MVNILPLGSYVQIFLYFRSYKSLNTCPMNNLEKKEPNPLLVRPRDRVHIHHMQIAEKDGGS